MCVYIYILLSLCNVQAYRTHVTSFIPLFTSNKFVWRAAEDAKSLAEKILIVYFCQLKLSVCVYIVWALQIYMFYVCFQMCFSSSFVSLLDLKQERRQCWIFEDPFEHGCRPEQYYGKFEFIYTNVFVPCLIVFAKAISFCQLNHKGYLHSQTKFDSYLAYLAYTSKYNVQSFSISAIWRVLWQNQVR